MKLDTNYQLLISTPKSRLTFSNQAQSKFRTLVVLDDQRNIFIFIMFSSDDSYSNNTVDKSALIIEMLLSTKVDYPIGIVYVLDSYGYYIIIALLVYVRFFRTFNGTV